MDTTAKANKTFPDTDTVLRALVDGQKIGFYELRNKTGLANEQIAAAIHTLRSENKINIIGFGERKVYQITDTGLLLSPPPPPVPDFHSPECDPRAKKKKKKTDKGTRIHSYKHIHGLVGKVSLDHNGNILLDPNSLNGKIYFALNDRHASSTEIAEMFPDVPKGSILYSNGCLVKMGLLVFDKQGKSRIYKQSDTVKAKSIAETIKTDTDDNTKTTVVDLPAKEPPPPPVATTSNQTLDTVINDLLKNYSLPDVLFELHVRLADDYQIIENIKGGLNGK